MAPHSERATMSALPAASLIICSRNRPGLLQDTVESVLKGEEVPAEIVILDQSERAHPLLGSYPQASPTAIHYIWSPSRGLSTARSIAVGAASHDILVFLDDDMLVAPNWFGSLVQALLDAGPGAVITGQVLPTAPESRGGFQLSIKVGPKPALYRGRIGRDALAGGHMALHRSVLAAVGGFDERLGHGSSFPAAEDNDLGFRLLEAGYSIYYAPQAVVYHRAWRTWRHYLPLRWNYGLGQGAFYAKHLHKHDMYMLRRLGQDIHYFLRRPSRFVREPRWAGGYALFLLGILAGGARWLLTQRPKDEISQANRRSAGRVTSLRDCADSWPAANSGREASASGASSKGGTP